MNKDVRKFVQSITHIPGVTVEQSEGTAHLRVLKDGKLVTTLPSTPSDHRWQRNARSALRQKGITPSYKPKREEVVVDPGVSEEALRAQLVEMKARRGETAALARFAVDEVGPMLGIRTFATPSAASVCIARFTNGGGLEEWSFIVVSEALRLWGAKQASVRRATSNGQTVVDEPPMPPRREPELEPEPARLCLTLDLGKLNALLEPLGIEVTL